MKPSGVKDLYWLRWLGPALAVIAVCGLPALAADRVVIGENYTDDQ